MLSSYTIVYISFHFIYFYLKQIEIRILPGSLLDTEDVNSRLLQFVRNQPIEKLNNIIFKTLDTYQGVARILVVGGEIWQNFQ